MSLGDKNKDRAGGKGGERAAEAQSVGSLCEETNLGWANNPSLGLGRPLAVCLPMGKPQLQVIEESSGKNTTCCLEWLP